MREPDFSWVTIYMHTEVSVSGPLAAGKIAACINEITMDTESACTPQRAGSSRLAAEMSVWVEQAHGPAWADISPRRIMKAR